MDRAEQEIESLFAKSKPAPSAAGVEDIRGKSVTELLELANRTEISNEGHNLDSTTQSHFANGFWSARKSHIDISKGAEGQSANDSKSENTAAKKNVSATARVVDKETSFLSIQGSAVRRVPRQGTNRAIPRQGTGGEMRYQKYDSSMAKTLYSSESARRNKTSPMNMPRNRVGNDDNEESIYGDGDSVFDDELNFEDSFMLQDNDHVLRHKLLPVLSSNAQVCLVSHNERDVAFDNGQGNYGVTTGNYDAVDGNYVVIDRELKATKNELSLNLNPATSSAADGSSSASASRLRKYVSSGSLLTKGANVDGESAVLSPPRPHPSPADSLVSLQRTLNKAVVVTEESLLSPDKAHEMREGYDEMDDKKKFDNKRSKVKLQSVGDSHEGRYSAGHGIHSERDLHTNSIRYSESLSDAEDDAYLSSRMEHQGEYGKKNDSHSSTHVGSARFPIGFSVRRPESSTSTVTDDESSSPGEQSGDLA